MEPNASVDSVSIPCNAGGAVDVCGMLLADKRSENTRRAYAYDLRAFFLATYGSEPSPELVAQFLCLTTADMTRQMLEHKAQLIEQHLTEATINRRMAAILSLVAFARRLGLSDADPADRIDAERARAYRDTRGIGVDAARRLLAVTDRNTLQGKRDNLLLLLLLENALRRAEITSLSMGDIADDQASLWIRGKGRGTQRERVSLSVAATAALRAYLSARRADGLDVASLFVSLSPAALGRPLTPDGVYKIVCRLAQAAGVKNPLSPHRLRHTSITLALDAVAGDIRRVQRLSRHARLETLQLYDDNRTDVQGAVTNQLSSLLQSGPKALE